MAIDPLLTALYYLQSHQDQHLVGGDTHDALHRFAGSQFFVDMLLQSPRLAS